MRQKNAIAGAATKAELKSYAKQIIFEYDILLEQARTMVVLSSLQEVQDKDGSKCSAVMQRIMSKQPRFSNLGVADLAGDVWCSGLPMAKPVNVKDRKFFSGVLETGEFSIGDYQVGRISGKPTIHLAYPVDADDGKLIGVMYAAIDLKWLENFASRSNLPGTAVLTLVDDNGVVIAQYPQTVESGQEAPQVSYLFDNIDEIEAGGGSYMAKDDSGQSYYIMAVPLKRPNQTGYIHFIISIPKSDLEASVFQSLSGPLGKILK